MIVSILVAILIPLIFLHIIWTLEIYAMSQIETVLGAIVWGFVVFELARFIQNGLMRSAGISFTHITLISAPILEEVLKAALLIALAARMRLCYAVDGAAYGFAIGTGFAMAENLHYISGSDKALSIALTRVLSVSLMHAYTIGIVGAVAGGANYMRGRVFRRRVALALGVAIFLHAVFNQIVYRVQGLPLILLAIIIGSTGTGAIIFLIQLALTEERQSISRELADISAGEVAAALNPVRVAQVLAHHQEAIGPDRAGLIQQYVMLQSQRGILRKCMSLTQRPHYIEHLKRQLQAVDQQIDALRGNMGLYTWLWLRSVVPSEESDLWAHLGSELQTDQPTLNLIVELNKRQQDISHKELTDRVNLLWRTSLFRDLKREDIEDLALLLSKQRFSVGDEVIEQGKINKHLYCVASGSLIASVIDEAGAETPITAYGPGDVFGQLSVLDQEPSPVSVSCADNVTLYTLLRADFITLIYGKPQVGLEVMRQLVREIRQQISLLVWMRQTTSEANGSPG